MKTMQSIAAALICAALLAACPQPTGNGGGGQAVTGDFTGTITVADASYWSNLQVGLFYSSNVDTDDSFYLAAVHNGSVRRLAMSRNSDGSSVAFEPAVVAQIVDNKNSPTARSYGVDLPVDSLPSGAAYYLIAWLDANGDTLLDMKDAATDDLETIGQAEFNRLPYFFQDGTLLWMGEIYYSDIESTFKYNGSELVPDARNYALSEDAPDFDFEITATSGF